MVVCSNKAKRKWYKASDDLDSRLRPHRYLSDYTLAYSLPRKPGFPEATDEVDTDAWIDRSIAELDDAED